MANKCTLDTESATSRVARPVCVDLTPSDYRAAHAAHAAHAWLIVHPERARARPTPTHPLETADQLQQLGVLSGRVPALLQRHAPCGPLCPVVHPRQRQMPRARLHARTRPDGSRSQKHCPVPSRCAPSPEQVSRRPFGSVAPALLPPTSRTHLRVDGAMHARLLNSTGGEHAHESQLTIKAVLLAGHSAFARTLMRACHRPGRTWPS